MHTQEHGHSLAYTYEHIQQKVSNQMHVQVNHFSSDYRHHAKLKAIAEMVVNILAEFCSESNVQ